MPEPLGVPAGKVGPIPREAFSTLTGLEILQRLMAKTLPTSPFAATMHIFPIQVERELVALTGEPLHKFLNPLETAHGGWTATLLDSAMGCAVHSVLGLGQAYMTVEMKVSYFKALPLDILRRAFASSGERSLPPLETRAREGRESPRGSASPPGAA